MTSTCYIYRVALIADGIGGFTETWNLLYTTICDLWETKTSEEENSNSANQELAINEWFITVPFNTDILEKDVIVVGSKSFDIVSVPLQQSLSTALRCRAISRNQFNFTT